MRPYKPILCCPPCQRCQPANIYLFHSKEISPHLFTSTKDMDFSLILIKEKRLFPLFPNNSQIFQYLIYCAIP